jgi:hypothetical protein
MFCPNCKCEYRDGFTTCSDCNLPLVDELPKTDEDASTNGTLEYIEYEFVATLWNQIDQMTITSVLDAEKMVYFIDRKHRLLVAKGLKEEVLAIMEAFNITL